MIRTFLKSTLAVAIAISAAGCQSSADKEQKEAAEAQQRADLEKSAAEQKLTSAKIQADIDVAKAQEVARHETDRAQGKADQQQNEADKALVQSRSTFATTTQSALDDLVKRRQAAETKLSHLKAPEPAAQMALKDVQDKETAIRSELKALETSTATSLDYTKAKVGREISDLKAAVTDLETRTSERRP